MDDIWIFGDSYADKNWQVNDDAYSWVTELEKTYSVHNEALKGTGPEYSIRALRNKLDITNFEDLKDTVLIFICSTPERLNLNLWNDPTEQVMLPELAAGNIKAPGKHFAKDLFKYYIDIEWMLDTELNIVCTVHHLGLLFKRTLFWSVNPPIPVNKKFYSTLRNDFHFPEAGLNDLSVIDSGGERLGPYADERKNHFSELNHMILHSEISQWIETGNPIDTSKIVNASLYRN